MRVGSVLSQPKWMILAIVMAILIPTAVRLGFWQIDRLEERRETNRVWEHRLSSDPVPWNVFADNDETLEPADQQYLRVEIEGEYLPGQLLVLNRPLHETNGHWLATPLRTDSGDTVIVVRGWVPFEVRTPADVALTAPEGRVRLDAIVVPSETDPNGEPVTVDGLVRYMDITVMSAHYDFALGDVYLQSMTEGPTRYPEVLPLPDVTDEGSHFFYVIQWFAFAIIGAVGFGAMVRREAARGVATTDEG